MNPVLAITTVKPSIVPPPTKAEALLVAAHAILEERKAKRAKALEKLKKLEDALTPKVANAVWKYAKNTAKLSFSNRNVDGKYCIGRVDVELSLSLPHDALASLMPQINEMERLREYAQRSHRSYESDEDTIKRIVKELREAGAASREDRIAMMLANPDVKAAALKAAKQALGESDPEVIDGKAVVV